MFIILNTHLQQFFIIHIQESRFYAGLDNGGDLCENVTCLGPLLKLFLLSTMTYYRTTMTYYRTFYNNDKGRCGVYKTLDGLRIAYLSGHSNRDDQNYAVQDNAHLKMKTLVRFYIQILCLTSYDFSNNHIFAWTLDFWYGERHW